MLYAVGFLRQGERGIPEPPAGGEDMPRKPLDGCCMAGIASHAITSRVHYLWLLWGARVAFAVEFVGVKIMRPLPSGERRT